MALREVKNQQTGEIAMFDDETGAIKPMPKLAAPSLKQVRNKQTGALALFDQDTGAIFPQQAVTQQMQDIEKQNEARKPGIPDEGRVQEEQAKLRANRPPLFMEKYIPQPPLKGLQENIGLPLAEFALNAIPSGRIVKAALGAGGSAAQDIMAGKTPSLTGMGIGALLGVVPEGVIQGGKWAARTAAKAFGNKPLQEGGKAAAREVLERAPSVEKATEQFKTVKAMTQSLENAGDEFGMAAKEIMKDAERVGLEGKAQKAILSTVQDMTEARLRGKPLNYGEIFQRARDINEQAGKATTNEGRIALRKIHQALINDISKVSPEAAEAVNAYRMAKRAEVLVNAAGSGSKSRFDKAVAKAGETFTPEEYANLEAIRKHIGPNWGGTFSRVATIAGLGGYLTPIPGIGPAATAGVVMSALVRLPGGMGVALARSLVSPEGELSKTVAPAVAQAVRSYIQENRNGNN